MFISLLRTLWAVLPRLLPWCAVFALGVLCGVSLLALCTASGQADDAARDLLSQKQQQDCAAE